MIRLLLLLTCWSAALGHAAEFHLACPTEVEAGWNVVSPPDGWETLREQNTARHRLRGATFTDGHPKEQGFLRPYNSDGDDRREYRRPDVYRFPAKYPKGLWLVCTYRDTPAIIFKRLSETPETCTITEQRSNSKALNITCR